MKDRLEDKIEQLYEPLRRRHGALRERLLSELPEPPHADNAIATQRRNTMRVFKYAGSAVAAAAAVIVAMASLSNPSASAAQAFEQVEKANDQYKGMIHMKMFGDGEAPSRLSGECFFNTVDDTGGSYFIETRDGKDYRTAYFASPKKNEYLIYRAPSGIMVRQPWSIIDRHDKTLDPMQMMRDFTTLQGMLKLARQNGAVTVDSQDKEGKLDRFNLTIGDNKNAYKAIILVDPASKLVQSLRKVESGKTTLRVEWTYGEKMESIYDLGVPRDVNIVGDISMQYSVDYKVRGHSVDVTVTKHLENGDEVVLVKTQVHMIDGGEDDAVTTTDIPLTQPATIETTKPEPNSHLTIENYGDTRENIRVRVVMPAGTDEASILTTIKRNDQIVFAETKTLKAMPLPTSVSTSSAPR